MGARRHSSLAAGLVGIVPLPTSSVLDFSRENLPPALETRLLELTPVLVAVHETRPYLLAAFAVLAAAVLAASLLAGLTGRIRRVAPWRFALLGILAFPAASTLMFVLDPEPRTGRAVVVALLAAWALAWGAAAVAAAFGGPRRALAGLLLGTAALLLADQWLGGPLSHTGVLSYSPLDGARFYGLGNEGAAILFATALLGGGLSVDGCPPGAGRQILGWLCLPLLGAVTVLTSAAPTLGANITVVVWGTVGFAIATVLASGRRIGWKHVLIALGVVAVLVVALSAFDLARPDGGSHLARTLRAVGREGISALGPLVTRKVEMNVRIFTATPASLLVVAGMAWLAYALARPARRLRDALRGRPAYLASLWGAIIGSTLALATEDSGIVIPALVLLYAAGSLGYVTTLRPATAGDAAPVLGETDGARMREGVGE